MAKVPDKEIQNRAIQHVTSVSAEFVSMTTNLRAKWLRYYKLYRLFKNETGMPWDSKLFIPRIFEVVEKIAPRMTAHNPQFSLVPKKPEATVATTQLSEYLNYVWEERALKSKVRMMAKNMLIYGTSIAKIEWAMETETEEERDGDNIITQEVISSEMPQFSVLDIFDFLVDPREEGVDDGVGVIHKRDNVHFQELLLNKEALGYFNLDIIELMLNSIDAKNREESEQESKFSSRGVSYSSGKIDETRLNIKEYWGRFSLTGEIEDEREYVITTVNNSIVIRIEENKRGSRPFVVARDMPVPNEFYGIGQTEALESLQVELNWLRGQRMDNANLVNNAMWLVDNDSGVDPSQLCSKPGNIIFKNPGTTVQALQVGDIKSSSYKEEDQINRDFQTVSGTMDTTDRGGSKGFTNTATGQRIRNEESSARFQYKIENLEEAIQQIGKKMLILAAENADQNVLIRKLNESGEFSFEEISSEVFAQVANGIIVKVETGSTSADTSFDRRNDAIAMWNLSLQGYQAGVPVDLVHQWKEVIRSFGVSNPEETLQQGGGQQPALPEEGEPAADISALLQEEEINL